MDSYASVWIHAISIELSNVNISIIPAFADIAPKLHGKRIFSVIDMKDGLWHIRLVGLNDASSKLCTFNSIFGRYSYTRLPFGISSTPEVFQKRANEIFGNIPNVFVIFDDLLIVAESDEEHEQTLCTVFERARDRCSIQPQQNTAACT